MPTSSSARRGTYLLTYLTTLERPVGTQGLAALADRCGPLLSPRRKLPKPERAGFRRPV